MEHRMIYVPTSLLLDRSLPSTAKAVWMAQRLNPPAIQSQLISLTGLSRHTVQQALPLLTTVTPPPNYPRARIPTALLAARPIKATAKVLYGLLQITPGYRHNKGQFTYASLSTLTHLSPNTLKLAITQLTGSGWIRTFQENRRHPIQFTLSTPEFTHSLAQVRTARRRYQRSENRGEALMQEYLSLLVDSNEFNDNARHGFLVNPMTGERLEFDRFYPPNVAFEFNGAGHYEPNERFTKAEVEAQRLRDFIKAGMALYESIRVTLIHAEDLTLEGMRKRIGNILPLRDVTGQEPLINWLEETSLAYRAKAYRDQARDAAPVT